MKELINILFSVIALFFLSGCGSSDMEFTPEMVEGQTIYTFNEYDNLWIRATFDTDGQLIYEILEGREVGGTYSIEDGKIVVIDDQKSPVIALDIAKATVWEVTGTDNDGAIWKDTWYLELQFFSQMLVGKRFLSEFVDDDIAIREELLFTETTLKVYNTDGELQDELPYRLEDGSLIVTGDNGEYTLFLMFMETDGKLNIWYLAENDSGHSLWTPIES